MSKELAIALPFSINSYGKVNTTTDQKKLWADRVRSVIGTSLRERLLRPSFGTIIPFTLFEGSDDAVEEIQSEIRIAFSQQLRLLRLERVTINTDATTSEITVEVLYRLPNDEVINTDILIGRVILDSNNPIFEELL